MVPSLRLQHALFALSLRPRSEGARGKISQKGSTGDALDAWLRPKLSENPSVV
jgi:hypothetical protein